MEGTRKQAFTVQVEDGRPGKDGRPALGPVFRNILAKDGFPPLEPDMRTSTAAGKYPNNRMLGWRPFKDGVGKDKPAKPCPPQPNDTCTIMYTSGTSGQPKGVMLSHESHGMYVKGVDLFMDKIDDKDLNALRDDLMELKPTLLVGVPRVYEKIYEGGLTETLGPRTAGYPDDMSLVGTVGVATTYTELRLEEVPEMGYDPLGVPARGEILIRGNTVFTGYYKNPELTNEVMADGWFHTGDIGEMTPDGILKVIDRKKNIFKLSQGEYVAVEYLEKVYVFPPIIEDIWVFGDSYRSNLVAVVNPHEENTMKWAASNRYKGSFDEICKLGSLKEYILTELATAAEKDKLRGFEYIKGVVLDPVPFDMERDLVTATVKRRNYMLKYYQPEIDKVHKKMEDQKAANKAK
ncbi:hypothetical protein ACQ4PT_035442 [Festuca glaucescens]